MNLLTRMKSPTSSVGRIDDDGILKGSARNERNRKTTSRTGKNDFEYSTQTGSCAAALRLLAKNSRSASHTTPVTAVSTNRIRAKFIDDQPQWEDCSRTAGAGRRAALSHNGVTCPPPAGSR